MTAADSWSPQWLSQQSSTPHPLPVSLHSQGRLFLFACNQATDGKLDSAIFLLLEKTGGGVGKRWHILQYCSDRTYLLMEAKMQQKPQLWLLDLSKKTKCHPSN